MGQTRPAMPSEYYSVREISERLGLSKMTIYRMIHAGEIPGAIMIGRSFRVRKVTFDLWLAENEVEEVAAR